MAIEKDINFEKFLVAGIRLGVASAGIKKENHKDLVLIELSEGTQTAAVFTQNAFCAAPVTISKKHLLESQPKYLLVNTGNANAGTGEQGITDALSCCEMVAEVTSTSISEVLPFSTGVIGEYLPVNKFSKAIINAYDNLSANNWGNAAKGILTTDTVVKAFTHTISI